MENIKQDDVEIEAKGKALRCYSGQSHCYSSGTCIPNAYICDKGCDCQDCSDEGPHCYSKGKLDKDYLNRKMKEKPMTRKPIDNWKNPTHWN